MKLFTPSPDSPGHRDFLFKLLLAFGAGLAIAALL